MNARSMRSNRLTGASPRQCRAMHAVRKTWLPALRLCGALAVVAFAAAVGQIQSVEAATLSFVPAGAQLDNDPINDLIVAVGQPISFEVMVDTVGLPGPLANFSYTVVWDGTELERTGLVLDGGAAGPGGNFAVDTPPLFFNPAGSTVSHTGGAIPAGGGAILLDRWDFTVLPGVVNNGVSDFRVEIFGASSTLGGRLVGVLPNYAPAFQQVEVQPNLERIPESSALKLAGTLLVAAGGLVRRRTWMVSPRWI